jgi:hypothetical protein
MWVPWRLRQGPHYAESLAEAREGVEDPERFEANLQALLWALKRDPRTPSEPYPAADGWVVRTDDPHAGYTLAIFFAILGEYELEMKWVVRGPL